MVEITLKFLMSIETLIDKLIALFKLMAESPQGFDVIEAIKATGNAAASLWDGLCAALGSLF